MLDDTQFITEAFLEFQRDFRVELFQTFPAQVLEILVRRLVFDRDRKSRQ